MLYEVITEKRSQANISTIVTSLEYDMGIMIYPNAQRLVIVTDEGEVLNKIKRNNFV